MYVSYIKKKLTKETQFLAEKKSLNLVCWKDFKEVQTQVKMHTTLDAFSFNLSVVWPQVFPLKDVAVWYQTGCAGWLLGQHNEGSFVRWRGLRGWFPLWYAGRAACAVQRGFAGFPPQGEGGVHPDVSARISWDADVSVGEKQQQQQKTVSERCFRQYSHFLQFESSILTV